MSKISKASTRIALATVVLSLAAWAGATSIASAECRTRESRCGKDWAFCPESSFLTPLVGDGCGSVEPGCPRPAHCLPDPKESCGKHWTEWRGLGEPVNDPCPAGCVPTERVGCDSRDVDAFFQMQYRERWACAGAPPQSRKAVFK